MRDRRRVHPVVFDQAAGAPFDSSALRAARDGGVAANYPVAG